MIHTLLAQIFSSAVFHAHLHFHHITEFRTVIIHALRFISFIIIAEMHECHHMGLFLI